MKKIALLGSTGSIGKNALDIARHLGKDSIQIVALAAKEQIDLLEAQAREFIPEIVAIFNKDKALILKDRLKDLPIEVVGGMEGIVYAASHANVDMVISAMVGSSGLLPTVAAIKNKKDIGLANKEILVAAGQLVMQLAKENNIQLIPIDSEHSALFQCLTGEEKSTVRRLILTASGGPFRDYSEKELDQITPAQALKHPNWIMGSKITIDSSTLMNKGLEVIEAHYLFDIPVEQIDVTIHPQSIIHSMVEYNDGSIIAQMSEPDMRLPIQYAMTYPHRKPGRLPPFDFTKSCQLDFLPPNYRKFPCLRLAFEALRIGGLSTCFLNAANEVLVSRFLKSEVSWRGIGDKLEKLMGRFNPQSEISLETILAMDSLARQEAEVI
ncbi:MAG: 1-deoxy-D-xylulose-5-phosphate reductoisomerase [Parachlamydiales bacterium]|nr:1-deoxy-D-xylulose-5-phosphate reductoisomerase [Parachlamydiales bacterium]